MSPKRSELVERVGPDPHVAPDGGPIKTPAADGCPDVWRTADGNYAVIGIDITAEIDALPPTAGCGPDERVVWLPKGILEAAAEDLARSRA